MIQNFKFTLQLKGGNDIQAECGRHVQKHGKLHPGNVYASKPGTLPCKMIIHAVGPIYKDGRSREAHTLFDAVFKSLKMAGTNQFKSIAIPAISTGIYRYPLKAATEVILDAVMEYYHEGNRLPAEVHLVNNDALTVNAFQETVSHVFGDDNAGAPHAPAQTWTDHVPKSKFAINVLLVYLSAPLVHVLYIVLHSTLSGSLTL